MISSEVLLSTVKFPKVTSPKKKKRPLALWDVPDPIKDARLSSKDNSSTRSTISRKLTSPSIQSTTRSPWQFEVDKSSSTENESSEHFQGTEYDFNAGRNLSFLRQSNVDLSLINVNQNIFEKFANTSVKNSQHNSTNIFVCKSEFRNNLLLKTVTKMESINSEKIKEPIEEKSYVSSPPKKISKVTVSNNNVGKNQECNKSGDGRSSELVSNLKSISCTDLDSNTKLFFNEKGWPVKIMRLSEDSPPKAVKPWPSRSSTVLNKSPKKENSTQKKQIPKMCKENKENSRSVFANNEITSTNGKETEKQAKEISSMDLELKSALNFLDETIDKYASDKNSEQSKDHTITIKRKSSGKTNKHSKSQNKERKTPEESKVCSSLGSARSNKYDSKEMKKYIQTKRLERKLQISEEVKKKQETVEMQRKNLEKLKAKAHQVLKKSSLKHNEESKPKWQGPLEEDSEISVPGIHIFDSKIPTARKPKLSAKSEKSCSTQPEVLGEVIFKDTISLREVKEPSNGIIELGNSKICESLCSQMDLADKNIHPTNKGAKKLRPSDKSPVKDPNLIAALAQAVSSSLFLPENNEEDQLRKNIERLTQSPKFSNGWDLFQLTPTDPNVSPSYNNRDGTSSLLNLHHPPRTLFPAPVSSPREPSDRKRHQIPPTINDNLESKKLCMGDASLMRQDIAKSTNSITFQDALMDVQAQLSQKENPEPEWMNSFIKPDPYRIMNVVKMKMLSHQKKETLGNEKRERLKQKVISRRSSIAPSEDETDAPSIVSTEEDFKILPDPLRLSDMNLPTLLTNTSLSSPESSHSSPKSSKTLMSPQKLKVDCLKSSVTSYSGEIPPLFLPESVQHLKLQSSFSHSDFSSSISYQQSSNLEPSNHPDTENTSSRSLPNRRRPVSPAPLSSSSKTISFNKTSTSRSMQSERVKVDSCLNNNNEQIEIGQVLSSAALRLQFHAELSRLDAFDQSLAQVIAAEQLYHMAQGMNKLRQAQTSSNNIVPESTDQTLLKTSLSDQPVSQQRVSSPPSCESDTSSRSQSQRSSLAVSEHLPLSVASEQVPSPVSEHLHTLFTSRTVDSIHSSLHSITEALSSKETKVDRKEFVRKQISPVSSASTVTPLASASPKNLHFLKVLIEDADFQRKQHQLLYKTQEDLIHAHYKSAITELEFRFSSFKIGSEKEEAVQKENETRVKIEEQYKSAITSIKEAKNHVLTNWSKRIDNLKKQREHLKKTMMTKPTLKLRSTENSPKKMTPLRSVSMTSVVESSSSSETSAVNQAFEEKKRVEIEKEKAFKFSRRKLEKELLKKYQEEVRKMQEIEKEKSLLMSVSESRSRRDKSTSPLESVLEATGTHSDTRDVACSVEEDKNSLSLQATSSLKSVEEARTTDVYNSESFESPESSETARQPRLIHRPSLASKPFIAARSNSKSKVLIKVPLSPRLQFRSKRRCSSGSDESVLLSQNETQSEPQSEQSDYEYEVRILALKEQKRQRSAELNRLHRELKRVQREQQKATEESLIKQIQVYDSYISQTKRQLEDLTSVPVVKPQIKHPRVSDKFLPRNCDIVQKQVTIEDHSKIPETQASDVETNSLKSISEASSTDTTIQSSGQAQVVEDLSQQAEDASKTNEASENLQNVETEASNSDETQSSIKSEILIKKSEDHIQNVNEESEEWVDAEEFFSQIDGLEKNLATHSKSSKISIEENISQSEVTSSPAYTISSESVSKSELDSKESKKSEDNVSSEINEENTVQLNIDSGSKISEMAKEESPQTLDNHILNSSPLDVGSIVSIISQAPSSTIKTPTSNESQLKSESQDSMQNIQSEEEVDISTSIATSSKSVISELISNANTRTPDDESVSIESILTSQHYLDGEENNSVVINNSEVDDENLKSPDSNLIKVFISNKKETSCDESSLVENLETPLDKTYTLNKTHTPNKTYTISESLEETEGVKTNDSKAEIITNYILTGLLRECFDDKKKYHQEPNDVEFLNQKNESVEEIIVPNETEQSVDYLTNSVLDEFVHDATDCMLKISESKKSAITSHTEDFRIKKKEIEDSENSSNQLLEALALENNTILSKKGEENITLNDKSEFSKIINSEVELSEVASESEGFWLEEELRPVSLQAQREAEELRLKQLQIEQEIKQLEQAQEHIPSYYYVREIPNKPPPPYTPPGQSSSKSKESPDRVPNRHDTEALVTSATKALLAVWKKGESVSAVQPPEPFSSKHVSNAAYKRFLFDLVKQTFTDITANKQNESKIPPWERTGFRMKCLVLPNLTEEFLSNYVMKKVRVLFGYEPTSIKENMIIQWSRKKRDRVDELLVRESQDEEQEWTDYSKCEVAVKNNVALSILDSLLEDTTTALCNVFLKKQSYPQPTT